jgi:class 3 adenylate cyclase
MNPTPDSASDDPQQIIADLRCQLADAQRRLDKRTAELDEAVAQQAASTEVLTAINSSRGDLAPVFEAILDKAMQLCGAAIGELCTYDGERFATAAIRGETPAFIEARAMNPAAARPGTGSRRVIETKRPLHILDMQIEAQNRPAESRALIELSGMRTSLTVPLLREESFLGFIRVYRREVKPFTDQQIALLESFAAQAVIAMENARLITETREALEQQTATAEVLQVINSSPGDLTPVFDAMLEKAHSLCGAEFGRLFTYDGETFWPVAAHAVSARDAEWMREGFRPAQSNPFVRVIEGAQIVHIADIRQVAAEFPDDGGLRTGIENGHRTFLVMPLRKDDVLLGVITAVRREVRPFTDKQIALLQNFAAQAVIAMENARLITETREALEQQTATAEVLGVINSSPGDLTPVFEAMLEKATRLCEAPFGQLAIYDGKVFRFVAAHGEEQFALNLRREPLLPSEGATWLRILGGEDVVHIPDARESDLYRSGHLRMREFVDDGGARSALWVALRKDRTLLGIFTIYRREARPFSDKQIALLQNFAAQAVIAMENARLLSELRQRTEEVGELNRDLEARVAEQVDELGRVGRLKRFLAPQLAELIVSQGDEKILESHRREIVVVFCDLRGYTAFTETAEPEEVLDFLREYHGALGPLVSQFEGTLDQFSGDGIMVFFNDPVPCADPAERAIKMAVAMREAAGTLIAAWRRRGRMLGFGAGIAQGYATLGQIGFADRSGYTAIGTVCNLAARLCAEAKDGQILVGQRVAVAVEETVPLEEVGELTLKGLTQPVVAYNVPLAAVQPALRVIEGGSPQTI